MSATYTLPEATGTLDFTEGYWKGADVTVRLTVPLGTYFEILEAVDSGNSATLRAALRTWADEALVSWNLVDRDGTTPIPADANGFERLPLQLTMDLVKTWLNTVPSIDLPFDGGSPGTATSGVSRARNRRRRS